MSQGPMQLGVTTFGEVVPRRQGGSARDYGRRLRDMVEEIELADQVGLDVFGVGEQHRPDYMASAPAVILAAAAARTKNIRLTSAVSVLSVDDPVRVFQDFATLDLLSGGRAEIMAGRGGQHLEAFPLFGCRLQDYDELFVEKLALLLKIRDAERVTWKGRHRPAIRNMGVYPRPVQKKLPIWIAVAGTPESVERAGALGLPMTLAIIGYDPARWAPLVDTFHDAARRAGHRPPPIAIYARGHVARTSQRAAGDFYPHYRFWLRTLAREQGSNAAALTRSMFSERCGPHGALVVGSPQEVIDKILTWRETFGQQRFLMHVNMAALPHAQVMETIELLGTRVAPALRRETGG